MKTRPPGELRLAILFWYYKAPEVCIDRLRRLRRSNPDARIYGLYGGPRQRAGEFAALGQWLDDSWCYEGQGDAEWKWRHGDLLIAAWFGERGHALEWDSVAVIQWDLLVFAPIERVFAPLLRDEIYLPARRPLSEVAAYWWWVRPDTAEAESLLAFELQLHRRFPAAPLSACQFIMAVLPRRFLERYATIAEPQTGFLEYKMPSYAAAFGLPFRDYPHLRVAWEHDPDAAAGPPALSAARTVVSSATILRELASARGVPLFHPVHRSYRWGRPHVAGVAILDAARRQSARAARWVRRRMPPA